MNVNTLLPEVTSINSSGASKKFMQVHTLDEEYLKDSYIQNLDHISGSYNLRMTGLINYGISGIHIIAPYMHDVGYEGQLIIANDLIAQMKWLLEHDIKILSNCSLQQSIVKAQIDYYKPDVIYLSDPIEFDSMFIRTLSHKPKLIIGWRATNIPNYVDWSEFDIILTNLSSVRFEALRFGAKSAEHFWPGFPVWYYDKIKDIQINYDVGFCGSWSSRQHHVRNQFIEQLALDTKYRNFNLALHLSGEIDSLPALVCEANKGARYGIKMLEAIRSTRIGLDMRGNVSITCDSEDIKDLAKNEASNLRIIEVTGCGRLLITEHCDNLHTLFDLGREILTYKSKNELDELLKYYCNSPQEAEEIAERGRIRCHSDHSMKNKVKELAGIIERYLEAKVVEPVRTTITIADNLFKPKMESLEKEKIDTELLVLSTSILIECHKNREVLAILADIDPKARNSPPLGVIKAVAYLRSGMIDTGIKQIEKVLELDKDNQQALQLLNKVVESGLIKNIINHKSSEEKFDDLVNQISIYLEVNNFISALKLIEEALELDSRSSTLLSAKAFAHYHLNDKFNALEVAKESLIYDPDNVNMIGLINTIQTSLKANTINNQK